MLFVVFLLLAIVLAVAARRYWEGHEGLGVLVLPLLSVAAVVACLASLFGVLNFSKEELPASPPVTAKAARSLPTVVAGPTPVAVSAPRMTKTKAKKALRLERKRRARHRRAVRKHQRKVEHMCKHMKHFLKGAWYWQGALHRRRAKAYYTGRCGSDLQRLRRLVHLWRKRRNHAKARVQARRRAEAQRRAEARARTAPAVPAPVVLIAPAPAAPAPVRTVVPAPAATVVPVTPAPPPPSSGGSLAPSSGGKLAPKSTPTPSRESKPQIYDLRG